MSGAYFRLLLASAITGLVTLAAAQTKKPASKFAVPGSADSAGAGSKETHGAGRGRHAAHARQDAAVATFPGFRLLPDGRSRIYVELTKAVSVEERRADALLVYVLRDARVPVRNNRNALITTHFATPVARARLLAKGPDLELVIDLRQTTAATHKVVASDNGGARLEVEFPAGDYPPAPGIFEPAPGKRKTREGGEPEASDQAAAPSAAPPSATAEPARDGSPARAEPPPARSGAPASPPAR
jgi:hypothetical protein